MSKIGLLKKLFMQIVGDIDAGNTNITEEEAMELLEAYDNIANKRKRLSKYQACKRLHISRATFDNYVAEGRIPKGTHQQGFRELSWSEKEIDEAAKTLAKFRRKI